MVIGITLEIMSIFIICDPISGTILNVIMNYISLAVIGEID